jgi:hypothetical protein
MATPAVELPLSLLRKGHQMSASSLHSSGHLGVKNPGVNGSAPRPQSIRILVWRSCPRNTLLGFTDVLLPSGLLIRGIAVHEKNGRKWLGLPARQYENDAGTLTWIPILELPDRARRTRFEELVLNALDEFIAARQ